MSIIWAMLKFSNPVTGILLSAVQYVWKAISYFFRGVFSFAQNPLELFAVACIAIVVFCFGVVSGIRYDAHKVKQAKLELATVYENMKDRDRADAKRAANAVIARREAEELERAHQANTAKLEPLAPILSPDSAAPVVAGAAPAGVRKPTNKVRRNVVEPSLFDSLQKAFE